MKKISEKIAEINLQPEHIRLRYVWGSVAICMLIVFAIWIFSIGAMFQEQKNSSNQSGDGTGNITEQLKDLKQQAPSIKNYTGQIMPAENEGVAAPAKSPSDFEYPVSENNTEIPQASGYSELPKTIPAQ